MSALKPELKLLVDQILALAPEDRKAALHAVFGAALPEAQSPSPEEDDGPLWYGRPVDQQTYDFISKDLGIFGIAQLEQPSVEEVVQANEKILEAEMIMSNVRWYLSDFEFSLEATRSLMTLALHLGILKPNYQSPTVDEIWGAILAGGWKKP
jgi:hypothetical protein